jgi:hypothetical protein
MTQQVKQKETKSKHIFKNMLKKNGYNNITIDELYKWYDSSKKKGVASF